MMNAQIMFHNTILFCRTCNFAGKIIMGKHHSHIFIHQFEEAEVYIKHKPM